MTGAALLAACGGGSGDLVALEVTGGFEARRTSVVVTGDGRARCGDGPLGRLQSSTLLEARELERDIAELVDEGRRFPPPAADRREYVARVKAGTVRWAEASPRLPPALARAQLLLRKVEREAC